MCTFNLLTFSVNINNWENMLSSMLILFILYGVLHCLTYILCKWDILFYGFCAEYSFFFSIILFKSTYPLHLLILNAVLSLYLTFRSYSSKALNMRLSMSVIPVNLMELLKFEGA